MHLLWYGPPLGWPHSSFMHVVEKRDKQDHRIMWSTCYNSLIMCQSCAKSENFFDKNHSLQLHWLCAAHSRGSSTVVICQQLESNVLGMHNLGTTVTVEVKLFQIGYGNTELIFREYSNYYIWYDIWAICYGNAHRTHICLLQTYSVSHISTAPLYYAEPIPQQKFHPAICPCTTNRHVQVGIHVSVDELL